MSKFIFGCALISTLGISACAIDASLGHLRCEPGKTCVGNSRGGSAGSGSADSGSASGGEGSLAAAITVDQACAGQPIAYTIENAETGTHASGTINVGSSNRAEISLPNLEVGTSYTFSASAGQCSGSADFLIAAAETTSLSVELKPEADSGAATASTTGSLGLRLQIPSTCTAPVANYTVERQGSPVMSGSIDLRGSSTATTLLSPLPVGDGYNVNVVVGPCTGTGVFNVQSGQTTAVSIALVP
jgi:hypothetical protein